MSCIIVLLTKAKVAQPTLECGGVLGAAHSRKNSGSPVDSQCIPSRSPVDPQWFPSGSSMVPQWIPSGSPVDPQWFPSSSLVIPSASPVVPQQFPSDPQWIPSRSPVSQSLEPVLGCAELGPGQHICDSLGVGRAQSRPRVSPHQQSPGDKAELCHGSLELWRAMGSSCPEQQDSDYSLASQSREIFVSYADVQLCMLSGLRVCLQSGDRRKTTCCI